MRQLMKFGVALVFAAGAGGFAVPAQAVDITPDFANVPTGWTTDRYEPDVFANVGAYEGRNDVLQIGIHEDQGSANRGGQSSTFYNTHGRKHAAVGGTGDRLSADLYVESAWSEGGSGAIRSDIWGVLTDGSGVTGYPIIGFANFDGAARFRVWDLADGWVDLGDTVNFDAWNSLAMEFTGSSIDYFVNGSLAYSDADVGGSTGFQEVIMQAYNFYDPALGGDYNAVNYEAHWSNTPAATVSEPGMIAPLAMGLVGLGAMGLRRRQK